MINFTVLYPNTPNTTFDVDYYVSIHMPQLILEFGTILNEVNYELGIAGGEPNSPPAFYGIAHLTFESMETLMMFINNASPIVADIGNFTDTIPIIQVSELTNL
ncbi:MAG: EthD family reductase [Alphaproteobacteria bacterium]|jgi:uncharacterized protein (TIGR02118 family)|nr:EthD family reductase [Alphaproteobacteria bacterium]